MTLSKLQQDALRVAAQPPLTNHSDEKTNPPDHYYGYS